MKNKIRKFSPKEREFIDALAGIPGCYALYSCGVCAYVGQAVCLKKRILNHLRKRMDFDEIGVFDLSSKMIGMDHLEFRSLLNFEEMRLIEKLDPLENLKRPKFTWDLFVTMPLKVQRLLLESLPSLS